MKIILVHNPTAGAGDAPAADEIVSLIGAAGHQVSYQASKEKNWQQSLEAGADLVAVAGGDGTLAKVARRLVGKDVPLAVLPCGTANNLARTLGVTDIPWRELIAGWSAARRRPFDAGLASAPWGEKIFLESVGAGLFAWTMATSDTGSNNKGRIKDVQRELKRARKFMSKRLHKFAARPLNVRLDGRDLSGEFLLLEAMNIKSIGPNLGLAPDADPGDGWLDVVTICPEHHDRLKEHFQAGENEQTASFTIQRCKHLQIQGERPELHLDDRPWPAPKQAAKYVSYTVDVRLQSHALVFLTPA
jgi:diacylglycerol kinase family enzyme